MPGAAVFLKVKIKSPAPLEYETSALEYSIFAPANSTGSASEEKGIVKLNDENYLVVKYSRGDLPEIRLLPEVDLLKKGQSELVSQAKNFLFSLQYRESTILLQGIKLVQRQREFFEKGPGFIKPMTRKQMADELSLHESTISRITGKPLGELEKIFNAMEKLEELYSVKFVYSFAIFSAICS
mgnify:CR=1 FL=1